MTGFRAGALLAAFVWLGGGCDGGSSVETRQSALSTPTFVQQASSVPQSPQPSVSVTLPSVVAGDLIVVAVGWTSSTVDANSVTDSRGNSYAKVVGPTRSGAESQSLYYAQGVAGGTTTVNAVLSGAAAYPDLRAAEYAGVDTVNALDAAASAGGSSTSSSTSIQTTAPGELLIAANRVATRTVNAGSGWTSRVITVPDGDLLEDRLAPTVTSYVADAPLAASGAWVIQAAALRAGSGAGGAGGTGGAGGLGGSGGSAGMDGGGGSAGSGVVFPLKVSANGHTLVDQTGAPFFMVGDSAWDLIPQLSASDLVNYLSTRKAQGFNTILMELTSHNYASPNDPADPDGDLPFSTGTDGQPYTLAGARGAQHANFATPNDAYYAHAASVVDAAAAYGMLVIGYVMPWGYNGDHTAGWWADVVDPVNTQAVCNGYGRYLATGHGAFGGFASKPNLIFTDGSDYGSKSSVPPSAEGEARMRQLLDGMVAAGAVQLRGGDWEAPSLSTDEAAFADAMAVNGVYTYGGQWGGTPGNVPHDGTTYVEASIAWQASPPAPAFLKETFYEHSNLFGGNTMGTTSWLRRLHYWAILGGATNGLVYGNELLWPFRPGWAPLLTDPGVGDVTRLGALFGSVPWWTLAPTTSLVLAGGGSFGATDYVTAALAPDGKLALAFMPTARTIVLTMAPMSGSTTARWFDPSTGATTTVPGSPFTNSGLRNFIPPSGTHADGGTDWVLVLTAP
jgi:hypothetical protein